MNLCMFAFKTEEILQILDFLKKIKLACLEKGNFKFRLTSENEILYILEIF